MSNPNNRIEQPIQGHDVLPRNRADRENRMNIGQQLIVGTNYVSKKDADIKERMTKLDIIERYHSQPKEYTN